MSGACRDRAGRPSWNCGCPRSSAPLAFDAIDMHCINLSGPDDMPQRVVANRASSRRAQAAIAGHAVLRSTRSRDAMLQLLDREGQSRQPLQDTLNEDATLSAWMDMGHAARDPAGAGLIPASFEARGRRDRTAGLNAGRHAEDTVPVPAHQCEETLAIPSRLPENAGLASGDGLLVPPGCKASRFQRQLHWRGSKRFSGGCSSVG